MKKLNSTKNTSSINFLYIVFIFLLNSTNQQEIAIRNHIDERLVLANKKFENQAISLFQLSDVEPLRSPFASFYIELGNPAHADAKKAKDDHPVKDSKAEHKTTNTTTTTNTTNTTTTSTSPAKPSDAKAATPQSTAADAAKAKEDAEQKAKLAAAMEKNNAKINDLEKKVDEQGKVIEGVRNLVGNIDHLSQQVNDTQKSNDKIVESIKDLKGDYNKLMFKIQTDSVQTDQKLSNINTKLLKQVHNQLTLQLFSLQKELSKVQDEISVLDKKIKFVKHKIPNPDSVCSMYSSCSSCVTNSQCGWCSMTQTCVEGNAKGPLDGSCSFYDYNVCSGPRECTDYKDCNVSVNI